MPKIKTRSSDYANSEYTTNRRTGRATSNRSHTSSPTTPRAQLLSGSSSNIAKPRDPVLDEARISARNKLKQALSEYGNMNQEDGNTENKENKAEALAARIETQMFSKHELIDNDYRTNFRRLWISLKDQNADFATKLMHDELLPEEFAIASVDELKPESRRKSDAQMKTEAIRRCTISEVKPSDIASVKDGRESSKWGMGRSAASID